MITELRNQYENNVAKLKGDIKGFIQNNKPNYIKGNSCWFDSRKIHGTETNGYGVSLRVDGEFTSEFRDKLFGQGSKWMTLKEKDYDNYRKVWH